MKNTTILKLITLFPFILYFIKPELYYINSYEKRHVRILEETSAECTLFLNKNNEFPINKPCKVLLIGSGARNTVKGGLGSGDVESRYYTTCEEGLEKAGFTITSKEWLDKYIILKEGKVKEHLNYINYSIIKYNFSSYLSVSFPEYDYDLSVTEKESKADIAIYVISRNSGEGTDRRLIKGDIMLTDTEVKDILYLHKKFKKFMLVLNVCGVVDLSPVKEVSNILLISQLGVVTGDILADIILGKKNPSGKLATTWSSIKDYKFINNFGNINDTDYKEGVYVGYRYFNSEGIKPLYPFGFGLSYTNFIISKISLKNKKEEIKIKVKIKNIGKFPGKEVVQVYVSPSQKNKDKPYQSLVAFKKTEELNPLEETEINLSFKLSYVARYDEKEECYILDRGNYIIRVGNSSENTNIYGYIRLKKDIITQKLKNINNGYKTGFKDYKPKIILNDNLKGIQEIELKKDDFEFKKINYKYKYKISKKLLKLNDTELAYLCLGEFNNTNEKIAGVVGSTTQHLKQIKHHLRMTDGPAGLRIAKVYYIDEKGKYKRLSTNTVFRSNFVYFSKLKKISLAINKTEENFSNYSNVFYQYVTNIPSSASIAQSFNIDLAEQYGKIIGKEMKIFNFQLWLAPAMNIHRNILCGRNFEYFSEDPLISGKMAGSLTKGVQSYKNIGTTLKHFAGNNQETNRLKSNSNMSERALREIYLKGFQIAIEESQPKAIMTSYNLINGIHTSENKALLINVLRSEWNFKGLIMTDWSRTDLLEFPQFKYKSQNIINVIKGGNNIMMPGSLQDYNITVETIEKGLLPREDLLHCASKVYEMIELFNQ